MKTKHTQGPWVACKNPNETRGVGSYFVGPADQSKGFLVESCAPDLLANEANANLIAAAPDLLDALIALNDWAVNPNRHPDDMSGVLALAEKAIAKAKGEA